MTPNANDTPDASAPDAPEASGQSRKRRMAREPKAGSDPAAKAEASLTKQEPTTKERRPSKIAAVIALLERQEGATLAEMVEATGWLPHTTRAALTGLKKKGNLITKDKRDDVTCYRITEAA